MKDLCLGLCLFARVCVLSFCLCFCLCSVCVCVSVCPSLSLSPFLRRSLCLCLSLSLSRSHCLSPIHSHPVRLHTGFHCRLQIHNRVLVLSLCRSLCLCLSLSPSLCPLSQCLLAVCCRIKNQFLVRLSLSLSPCLPLSLFLYLCL